MTRDGRMPPGAQICAIGVPAEDWQFGDVAADGSFTIDGLAPETYVVRATAPGHSPLEVEARAGGSELELVLKRADDVERIAGQLGEIHGLVVDGTTGEPLAVAHSAVHADWVPADPSLDWVADVLPNEIFPRPAQSMIDGEPPPPAPDFHITNLRPGRCLVRASVAGYGNVVAGPFEIERGGHVTDVRLELEPEVTLTGTLRDPDGDPVSPAYVMITGVGPHSDGLVADADRAYREADGRGWISGRGRIARDGAFEWPRLPAGLRVRVVAVHPDWEPAASEPFVLGEGLGEGSDGLELSFTRAAPR